MPSNKKAQIWKKLDTKELYRTRLFRFRSDKLEMPSGKVMPNYYVMDFVDWVNVVALTKNHELVLIKQYRHAIEDVALEIPGGAIDPHLEESPEQAAARELLEETGYGCEDIKLLSSHHPNPALQSNRIWSYLATGCELKGEQNLDPFEEIEVLTVSIDDALKKIESGELSHSLILAAFHYAMPYLESVRLK